MHSLHLLLNWKLCSVKCTHITKAAIQLRIVDIAPDMGPTHQQDGEFPMDFHREIMNINAYCLDLMHICHYL